LFFVLAFNCTVSKNGRVIFRGGAKMASITFDTLRFANRLKAAGVSQQHAEAEA